MKITIEYLDMTGCGGKSLVELHTELEQLWAEEAQSRGDEEWHCHVLDRIDDVEQGIALLEGMPCEVER